MTGTGAMTVRVQRAAWGVAIVLAIAGTFSFVDRMVLTLLVAPIRAQLQIDDTAIGLLHGAAFGIFYTVMGLPFGRWADRGDRPVIMAAGLAVWTLATAACGLANGFAALFACRIVVAVGEAALSPSALSLLADIFPRERLSRAVSIFQMGIWVGTATAWGLGGSILKLLEGAGGLAIPGVARLAPWQAVFVVIGALGIPVVLMLLALPERRRTAAARAERPPAPPIGAVFAEIWRHRGCYLNHIGGFTLLTIVAYAVLAWVASVLVRVHGVPTAETGLRLGPVMLLCGPLGTFTGGWLADRWLARGRRDGPILVAMIAAATLLPAIALYVAAPGPDLAVAASALLDFAVAMPYGVATASLALIVQPTMRGQIVAVYLMISNCIGLTLGPLLVALLTERMFGADAAVGWSLLTLASLLLPAALLLFQAARAPYRRRSAALPLAAPG